MKTISTPIYDQLAEQLGIAKWAKPVAADVELDQSEAVSAAKAGTHVKASKVDDN
jgi:hypothetical protein